MSVFSSSVFCYLNFTANLQLARSRLIMKRSGSFAKLKVFRCNSHYEKDVLAHTHSYEYLNMFFFFLLLLLSLFCRVGVVADPHAVPSFTAAVALVGDWRYWSEWEGCKGGSSQCWIRFHSLLMGHTHTHTYCMVFNTIYFPLSFKGHRYTLNGPLWWYTLWLGST